MQRNAKVQSHILSLPKLWSCLIPAAAVCVVTRYSHHILRLFLLSQKFLKNICTLTSATVVPYILENMGFENKPFPLVDENFLLSAMSVTEDKRRTKLMLNLFLFT